MLAHEIVDRYVASLLETSDIWTKFACGPLWNAETARALANVGLAMTPSALVREAPEAEMRGQHLALTVCITDDRAWGPPTFVAEHASAPRRADIQHAAWKLLVTRATRRVLVAYHHAKSDVRDHDAIQAAVREVCVANPGRGAPDDIVVITASASARPTSAETLRAAHAYSIVGVMA